MREGQKDEYYYVLESGLLRQTVKGRDVGELHNKGSFGIYSLMANSPHDVTITSGTSCILWRLKRSVFQFLLVRRKEDRLAKIRLFINNVPLLCKNAKRLYIFIA